MDTRYAKSSNEEIWVRACAKFFQEYGEYDWYKVPKTEALSYMLLNSGGQGNPHDIRQRIQKLYESVGIRG